jgi:hypothetical protein
MIAPLPIQLTAADFAKAVESAEYAWKLLQADKGNQRLQARYIRRLRACHRIRAEIQDMTATGKL